MLGIEAHRPFIPLNSIFKIVDTFNLSDLIAYRQVLQYFKEAYVREVLYLGQYIAL